jgi:AAA domain/Domain of unknown function (DUF4062)
MTPVLFELGARPHPPQQQYRSYLEQSGIFVGIYRRGYGWVAPGEKISGLEDEYALSIGKPRLLYVKDAEKREFRLDALLDRLRADGVASYKHFETAEELRTLVALDLALLISERFRGDAVLSATPAPRGLPARATSVIGRGQEMAEVEHLLAGGVRLLTLTGPGGIGKTRLSLEAAELLGPRYPDGVVFVPLDGLESADLVCSTIAAALGIRDAGGEALARLIVYVHGARTLLVLDNFEHVVAAAPELAALLESAPAVTVIATSREPLRLRAECELRVPPLATETEAVKRLAERGRRSPGATSFSPSRSGACSSTASRAPASSTRSSATKRSMRRCGASSSPTPAPTASSAARCSTSDRPEPTCPRPGDCWGCVAIATRPEARRNRNRHRRSVLRL